MRVLTAFIAAVLVAVTAVGGALSAPKTDGKVYTGHGFSMFGDLKYPANFTHFAYVNPGAPKGGDVKLAAIGTFDSLHPFILKGVPAAQLVKTFDTLMVGSSDEAFSEYGLIAESIEVPSDRSWVAFTLRPEAKFHDGTPITVEDVIWSLETLKTKGHPFFRSYYRHVTKAEKTGDRKVKFTFDGQGQNRELPLIVGQMAVMSKAYWAKRDFDKTTLEPVLGSGPYKVDSFEAGRFVVYRRVPNYWGAKLPVNAGRDNFDTIRIDYYRDGTVALEAFKAGQYDFRAENEARKWATSYTGPQFSQGLIAREEIKHEIPTGMQAYVFNERRPMFQDRRVRAALAHAFDFEWSNKNLFYGAYTRTRSYFSNSELAATGLPGPDELKVLEPFRSQLPEEVFTKEYVPPKTDGSGNLREGLREALGLLQAAGWTVKGQKLVNAKGEPMQFEILGADPAFERISQPFTKNLDRLGIQARVRTVDTAQYQKRLDTFDYDVIVHVWGQSLSPGNEQRDFWHSSVADVQGSRNYAGIKDPVVDKLIDLVIQAPDRPALIARTRALDRVLLWGHHVIPQYHHRAFRVAYWDKFGRPATTPKYNLGFDGWWVDAKKSAELEKKRAGAK